MSTSKIPKAITISIKGENSQKKRINWDNVVAGVHPNGGRHTYSPQEVIGLAQEAEKRCAALELSKASRIGATLVAVSGEPVAKAYSYRRLATRVVMVRVTTGWRVISITAVQVQPWGGHVTLQIEREQVQEATRRMLQRVGAERL